jgi:Tfp pilus assembly protein PilP
MNMKRNLAFVLIMASAALAQTPAATGKPAAKPSAATVVVPSAKAAQPSPAASKVTPSSKPATVSVQPAPVKAAAVPAKPTVTAPAKVAVTPAKAVATPVGKVAPATPAAKPIATQSAKAATTSSKAVASTPAVVSAKPAAAPAKVAVVNRKAPQAPAKKGADVNGPAKEMPKATAQAKSSNNTVAVKGAKSEADKKQPKAFNAAGRRDPFISPVVKLGSVGSGCSSGKRCLAIDQIALKGIVKSDVGMIAVVINAMNKAYFLRENDPVFNGYVVKITGDSIVFKETFHDRLGKPLTRDVTKTISRPAV